MIQQLKYCPNCKEATLHNIDRVSHVAHFILTMLTFGFWVPIWVLMLLIAKKPTCCKCGCQQ